MRVQSLVLCTSFALVGCIKSDSGTVPSRPQDGPPVDQARATAIIDAALETQDDPAAVRSLDQLLTSPLGADQRARAKQAINTLVWNKLSDPTVQGLYDELPHNGDAWPVVAHRSLSQALASDNVARATEIATDLRTSGQPIDAALRESLDRVDALNEASPNTVGVLLPLSGRGRDVGRAVLQGMQTAARLFTDSGQPIELVVRDSGGPIENVSPAVDALVDEHRVVAIVGPVAWRRAQTATRAADRAGVPIVTLSAEHSVSTLSEQGFRYFISLQEEIGALVARAEGRPIALMYPDDAYGRRVATALRAEVAKRGAALCFEQSYEAGTTAFAEGVAALKESRCGALLLADRASANAILSATLAVEDLALTLLVPSTGFSSSLLRTSSRYMQGAWVVRHYVHDPNNPHHRSFFDAYRDEYGMDPGAFAAHGFDVYRLIASFLRDGQTTRKRLATALLGSHINDPLLSFGGLSEQRVPSAVETTLYRVQDSVLVRP